VAETRYRARCTAFDDCLWLPKTPFSGIQLSYISSSFWRGFSFIFLNVADFNGFALDIIGGGRGAFSNQSPISTGQYKA
jgi:hypothetical protein